MYPQITVNISCLHSPYVFMPFTFVYEPIWVLGERVAVYRAMG